MRKDRLERLAKVMDGVAADTLKREAFDMTFYYKEVTSYECGFAGCALGWGASDPELMKQGLLIRNATVTYVDDDGIYTDGEDDAAEEFFEINDVGYLFLFEPSWYDINDTRRIAHKFALLLPEDLFTDASYTKIPPELVAKRIRFYIEFGDDMKELW